MFFCDSDNDVELGYMVSRSQTSDSLNSVFCYQSLFFVDIEK